MSDEPPSHNYATALSHLCLAGTSIHCMYWHYSELNFGTACFSYLIINSLIGIWRWGNPEAGDAVRNIYNHLTIIQNLVVLPCCAAELWFLSEFPYPYTFAHFIPPALAWQLYLYDGDYSSLHNISVISTGISLAYVSFTKANWYGLAAAISYFLNHFAIKDQEKFQSVPPLDLYNYGLCFFAFFALRAMNF